MNIYFPMTCDILTPGHIKCLEYLVRRGRVTVGLLTDEALAGYKKNVVSFEDRLYILGTLSLALGFGVVPQHTLDPKDNLRRYKMDALATGDTFEDSERLAADSLGLKRIMFKLRGEKKKRWSSSAIKNKIKKI